MWRSCFQLMEWVDLDNDIELLFDFANCFNFQWQSWICFLKTVKFLAFNLGVDGKQTAILPGGLGIILVYIN